MDDIVIPSIWQTERIRLRAIEPSDWEVYYRWNQDDEMTGALDWVWFPQSREAVRRWAEEASLRRPANDAFHWVIEDAAGTVVGSIATHDCDRRYGTFAYGLNVHAFNQASIRLHERLGFRLEGRLRRMVYTRGQHVDSLLFGLTAEEFGDRHPAPPWHGNG